MCYNLLLKPLICYITSALTQCDSCGFGAPKWITPVTDFPTYFCWTGVATMPSVVYLCIALFTELFDLASGDIPVLITVPTLVQSQASADSTFPRSWIIKTRTFIIADKCSSSVKSRFVKQDSFFKKVPSSQLSCSDNSVRFHYRTPHSSESPLIGKVHTTLAHTKKYIGPTHCLQGGLWCLTLARGKSCWTFWSPCQTGASGW